MRVIVNNFRASYIIIIYVTVYSHGKYFHAGDPNLMKLKRPIKKP